MHGEEIGHMGLCFHTSIINLWKIKAKSCLDCKKHQTNQTNEPTAFLFTPNCRRAREFPVPILEREQQLWNPGTQAT
jgi:hypothetical protein